MAHTLSFLFETLYNFSDNFMTLLSNTLCSHYFGPLCMTLLLQT